MLRNQLIGLFFFEACVLCAAAATWNKLSEHQFEVSSLALPSLALPVLGVPVVCLCWVCLWCRACVMCLWCAEDCLQLRVSSSNNICRCLIAAVVCWQWSTSSPSQFAAGRDTSARSTADGDTEDTTVIEQLVDDAAFVANLLRYEYPTRATARSSIQQTVQLMLHSGLLAHHSTKQQQGSTGQPAAQVEEAAPNRCLRLGDAVGATSLFVVLSNLLQPLIASYWVTACTVLQKGPERAVPLTSLIQQTQWVAKAMVHEGTLHSYESISLETITNATRYLSDLAILTKQGEQQVFLPASQLDALWKLASRISSVCGCGTLNDVPVMVAL